MGGRLDGWLDGRVGGWLDGGGADDWMDGWRDGWMDGRMDVWMDGWEGGAPKRAREGTASWVNAKQQQGEGRAARQPQRQHGCSSGKITGQHAKSALALRSQDPTIQQNAMQGSKTQKETNQEKTGS